MTAAECITKIDAEADKLGQALAVLWTECELRRGPSPEAVTALHDAAGSLGGVRGWAVLAKIKLDREQPTDRPNPMPAEPPEDDECICDAPDFSRGAFHAKDCPRRAAPRPRRPRPGRPR